MRFDTHFVVLLAVTLLALLGGERHACAQQIAVKTNVLADALLTPDLGFEMVTGEHSSLSINVSGHWKPYGVQSKLIAVQPQFRWWFGGRPLAREYVGLGAIFTGYDMAIGDHSYSGLAGGLGITGGYVLQIGKRWCVDFSGGVGLVAFGQRRAGRHDNFGDLDAQAHNSRGYKLIPINLGVSFVYIIK